MVVASDREAKIIVARVLYVRPDSMPGETPPIKANRAVVDKATADAIDAIGALTPGPIPKGPGRPNAIHGADGGLFKPNYKYATSRELLTELFGKGSLQIEPRSGNAYWLPRQGEPLHLGRLLGPAGKERFALSPRARQRRDEIVGEAMIAARKEQLSPTRYHTDRWGNRQLNYATAAVPRDGRETLSDGTRVERSAGVWYSDNGRGPFLGSDGNPAETVATSAKVQGLLPTVLGGFSQARTPSATHSKNGATAVMMGHLLPYTLRWVKDGVAKAVSFTAPVYGDKWMVVKQRPLPR